MSAVPNSAIVVRPAHTEPRTRIWPRAPMVANGPDAVAVAAPSPVCSSLNVWAPAVASTPMLRPRFDDDDDDEGRTSTSVPAPAAGAVATLAVAAGACRGSPANLPPSVTTE